MSKPNCEIYNLYVNKFCKRIVNFNCKPIYYPCIISSLFGKPSASNQSNIYPILFLYINLYFDNPTNYGYNLLLDINLLANYTGYWNAMICITDNTNNKTYYWNLVGNLTINPTYNELNVNPALAYILENNKLILVNSTTEPTFITTEIYSDNINYYVLNKGTYNITLWSSTLSRQLSPTYLTVVNTIDTSTTIPSQIIKFIKH